MPADFDKCVAEGGKTRTISVNATQYMHVCYDKNGKSHSGEVRTRAKKNSEAMEELFQIHNKQRDEIRQALEDETKISQDNLKTRVENAKRDPSLNIS